MHRSFSQAPFLLAIGFVGVSIGCATASSAPAAAWDQARVTEIAQNLANAVDALYTAEFKAPEDMGEGDSDQNFMDDLRQMHDETQHLAAALGKGAIAKHTRGSVERIVELNDSLAEDGRRMALDNPVLNQFAAFESLVNQLRPYYGLEGQR